MPWVNTKTAFCWQMIHSLVKFWMQLNFLKLNSTEARLFSALTLSAWQQQESKFSSSLAPRIPLDIPQGLLHIHHCHWMSFFMQKPHSLDCLSKEQVANGSVCRRARHTTANDSQNSGWCGHATNSHKFTAARLHALFKCLEKTKREKWHSADRHST